MKKICSLLLTMVLISGMTTVSYASESRPHFTDVPESFWAYNYIERAYADGVVTGTSGNPAQYTGMFSPDQPLTNAQFATILAQGFFQEELDMSIAAPWYMPYVTVLDERGLLAGTAMKAQPNAIATRYDMAIVMAELLSFMSISTPSGTELQSVTIDIGDWNMVPPVYQEAVATVYSLGLISGINEQGDFAGDSGVTRAAMCTIYCNLSDLIQPEDNQNPVIAEDEYYHGFNYLTYGSVVGVPLKRDESTAEYQRYVYECDFMNGDGYNEISEYVDYLIAEHFQLLGEDFLNEENFFFAFFKYESNSVATSISIVVFPSTNEVMVIVGAV